MSMIVINRYQDKTIVYRGRWSAVHYIVWQVAADVCRVDERTKN